MMRLRIEQAIDAFLARRFGGVVLDCRLLQLAALRKSSGATTLLRQAQEIARSTGLDLNDVPVVGGGSDGNFTAALAIPTLDDLGVEGGGAPTLSEDCRLSSIPAWVRFLSELLLA